MHSLRPAETFKIRNYTQVQSLPVPVGHQLAIVTAKVVDSLGLISVKVFSRVNTLAIIQVPDRTALIDRLPLKCKQCNSQYFEAWIAPKPPPTCPRSKCHRYRNAWSQSASARQPPHRKPPSNWTTTASPTCLLPQARIVESSLRRLCSPSPRQLRARRLAPYK